jgi:ABC-2 type transport system ATP-binding protein
MRCEIAASLLHNPKILFLDEPTIGLDAVSKISVRKFIKDINKENNTTVILTTHDMQDIEALTNRIMLIGKGELLYNGNLEDIKKRYSKDYKILVEYEYTDLPLQLYDVDVLEHTEQNAVLSFNTNIIKMPEVLNQLSNQVHLLDVDVISSPIEEVIANMYEEMKI